MNMELENSLVRLQNLSLKDEMGSRYFQYSLSASFLPDSKTGPRPTCICQKPIRRAATFIILSLGMIFSPLPGFMVTQSGETELLKLKSAVNTHSHLPVCLCLSMSETNTKTVYSEMVILFHFQ